MLNVGLVTCAGLPELTEDDRLLRDALVSLGARASPVIWSDAAVGWEGFDRLVLRSCWDYHLRPAEFGAWIDAVELSPAELWNPPAVVRANMDKRYLERLARLGVAVLPSVRVTRGDAVRLSRLLDQRGWRRAVVKPAISASAHRTWLTSIEAAASEQSAFESLLREGDALVQPFAPEVAGHGEWSLVFLAGAYSHAVLKRPAPRDFRVQREFGGTAETRTPPPRLVEQAQRVVDRIEGPWLYARVDAVERSGDLLLMELELIEPELFLGRRPDAPRMLAEAVLAAGAPPPEGP